MPLITLTTDYGSADYFVGSVKGVLLGIAPGVCVVDITHEIGPHQVAEAAFVLRQVWPHYPPGTIHVAIVDPGVGSARRILLARVREQYLIAPDNGLVTWLYRDFGVELLISVEDRQFFASNVSATFHGRDILTPVAAHLANGVRPDRFGPNLDRAELLAIPHRAETTSGGLSGQIIYTDRFGNLVTNIHESQLASGQDLRIRGMIHVNGESVGAVHSTFSDVAVGESVAIIGSTGFVEIAVNLGRADERFGPTECIIIHVEF